MIKVFASVLLVPLLPSYTNAEFRGKADIFTAVLRYLVHLRMAGVTFEEEPHKKKAKKSKKASSRETSKESQDGGKQPERKCFSEILLKKKGKKSKKRSNKETSQDSVRSGTRCFPEDEAETPKKKGKRSKLKPASREASRESFSSVKSGVSFTEDVSRCKTKTCKTPSGKEPPTDSKESVTESKSKTSRSKTRCGQESPSDSKECVAKPYPRCNAEGIVEMKQESSTESNESNKQDDVCSRSRESVHSTDFKSQESVKSGKSTTSEGGKARKKSILGRLCNKKKKDKDKVTCEDVEICEE